MNKVIKTARWLMVVLCWTLQPALAQSEKQSSKIDFNIPELSAEQGINTFAEQAQRAALFPFDAIQSFKTKAVVGRFTLDQALELLLEDTGLMGRFNEAGILMVDIAGQPSPLFPDQVIEQPEPQSPVIEVVPEQKKEPQPPKEDDEPPQTVLEEIVTIGTRTPGRAVVDSPVPIDILSSQSLTQTGATEVGRMIQALAPSFNFSSSTISDGTDALRPATLRGLGPDQTLVLVNGKRRHGSALIHVNTSVGRGTAGTDMNAIPGSAIQRVEVLRDGAAAQYGSDAIAGVINIVLKDDSQGGELTTSYGEYQDGDGEQFVASYYQGVSVGQEGHFSFGLEYRDQGSTNRAGLSGACQYVDSCIELPNGSNQTTDPREVAFERRNFRIGDADTEHMSVWANLGLPLGSDHEFYAFLTYSARENTSGGFYRRANQSDRNPTFLFDGITPVNGGQAFFPDGFLPLINTDIDDLSLNTGITGELGNGWSWDLSAGYGMNDFAFHISNSINASLVSATGTSPTSAFAGELSLGLLTIDFDMYKPMEWGSLAWGAAYREDSYEIRQGEEISYKDFDTVDGVSLGPSDAAAGIQVFPGFQPENEVDEDRDAKSVYLDIEYDELNRWLFGTAIRLEDYSDFGNTLNAKVSASFDLTEVFRIRGAVSSGFRAPSLQQQFFNNTSTQFVSVGNTTVAQQRGTFRNDSAVAGAIGIPSLEEETSLNASIGFVTQPTEDWTISVDYYNIRIDDRIVISGAIGMGHDPALDAALAAANANSAQFFLNAADTTTQGLDLIASHRTEIAGGLLDLSVAANFTDTEIDSVVAPESLSSVPGIQDLIFTSQDRSILEEWQPENRINLSAVWDRGPLGITVAINRYGAYTVQEGNGDRQTYGAEVLVDTQVRYDFDNGLGIKLGGVNIFDQTPDTNLIGQSRAGTIVDVNGNVVVSTPGVFAFSRRSAPFGFNGAYYYAGVEYRF